MLCYSQQFTLQARMYKMRDSTKFALLRVLYNGSAQESQQAEQQVAFQPSEFTAVSRILRAGYFS